jgi:hypothetical protein
MIRPLLTAITEYLLAFYILKRGKNFSKTFFLILFFLATYQLGEVILFATDGNRFGLQVSYFATTMLPPLGLLLLERIVDKKLGYTLIQIIGSAFALTFLISPDIIANFSLGDYCVMIESYGSNFTTAWTVYYLTVVSYTMVLILYFIWKSKKRELKNFLWKLFFGYNTFFTTALLIVILFPGFQPKGASLMCALGFFGALVFAWISLGKKQVKTKNLQN